MAADGKDEPMSILLMFKLSLTLFIIGMASFFALRVIEECSDRWDSDVWYVPAVCMFLGGGFGLFVCGIVAIWGV